MDKLNESVKKTKLYVLLCVAFLFLFFIYFFSGAWFTNEYILHGSNYFQAMHMVAESSAFWIFFIVQLSIYLFCVFVVFKLFYNERKMTLMQQEFVNNVTHEIKTPLSTILMAAEVLVEENIQNKPFRKDQYISIIRNEGEKLREELDRVLNVSRISNIGVHLNKEVLNPKELVFAILDRMNLQFKNYNAIADVQWNADNAVIHFDKKSFELILTNIIDNSLKYNISEPIVVIRAEIQEGSLIIGIEDNGIGIAESYHSDLFQRFFRVPLGETHHIKGFGLGLYLVKQLIDAHKSAIFVSSKENNGTTVTLKIPLVTISNE